VPHLEAALESFASRERRYGLTRQQINEMQGEAARGA